jgi:hypothetical protein
MSKLLVDEISDADNTGPVTVTDGLNVSSGNVGIGTSSPIRQLSLQNASNAEISILSGTSSNCSILMGDGTTGADVYRGYLQYNNATDTMLLRSAGPITIEASGGLRLRIDGDGIKFNGDTAAANALDDYEEGVFLPFTGIGSGYTGEVLENAQYTKIGRMVYINLRMKWTGTDGVGNPAVFIMPFTHATATATGTTGAIMYSGTQLRSGAALIAHMATNSNELYIYSGAGGAFSALTRAEFNGAYDLAISFCYYVA